jgi:proton glutamate symport protein
MLDSAPMTLRRLTLTQGIFLGMAVGIVVGHLWPATAGSMTVLSQIFLRLIKSIVAPLIFATLVVGVAGAGDFKKLGRLGLKAVIYFEIVTTVALFIGLGAVNLVQPGVGVNLQAAPQEAAAAVPRQSASEVITHIFPTSIMDAMARGDVLQIVVFAILFAAACSAIGAKAKPVLDFCGGLAEVMFRYTGYVMKYAPIGVGAAIAVTVGSKGLGVLKHLGLLIITFYIALAIFVVFVLGAVCLAARVPIGRFARAVREPVLIAFSTTSSEAALPLALERMEQFGISRRIVSFVIPTGYSFNLDGSTLYLSLASVFVAQAAGVHLTIGQQLVMMLTLMLTSKGVAGVSRAALVILAGTVASFHLPLEGVAVLLGIDQLMDMARTAVNVLGNCLACVVMARWEREFPPAGEPARLISTP